MKAQTFTPEQLETIQLKIMALLVYVRTHDSRELPYCFRHCERIVKNINICRSGCYSGIEELTQLIREDWRSASHVRTGLGEYCIPNAEMAIQINMNTAISKQILAIEKQVNG